MCRPKSLQPTTTTTATKTVRLLPQFQFCFHHTHPKLPKPFAGPLKPLWPNQRACKPTGKHHTPQQCTSATLQHCNPATRRPTLLVEPPTRSDSSDFSQASVAGHRPATRQNVFTRSSEPTHFEGSQWFGRLACRPSSNCCCLCLSWGLEHYFRALIGFEPNQVSLIYFPKHKTQNQLELELELLRSGQSLNIEQCIKLGPFSARQRLLAH